MTLIRPQPQVLRGLGDGSIRGRHPDFRLALSVSGRVYTKPIPRKSDVRLERALGVVEAVPVGRHSTGSHLHDEELPQLVKELPEHDNAARSVWRRSDVPGRPPRPAEMILDPLAGGLLLRRLHGARRRIFAGTCATFTVTVTPAISTTCSSGRPSTGRSPDPPHLQSNWQASPGAKLSGTNAAAVAVDRSRCHPAAYRRTAS